ncbi:MAG TPA: NUDIX domain-containing protein [Candidatus Babeliaceae bacterium]|nr:NUDIX domain-containing protein [Candidatus Babeliaceae bacterium]
MSSLYTPNKQGGIMVTSSLEKFFQKEATRFKLKVGVLLFLIQNDAILLLRRFQTGTDDGLYVVPMGGHDGNEPVTSSLIREAKEEANLLLKPGDLTVCHVMHRLHHMTEEVSFEQIDIIFKAHQYEGTLRNNEPDHCDELAFYPLNNLPENTAPFIRHAIDCVARECFFSEFGWKEKLP